MKFIVLSLTAILLFSCNQSSKIPPRALPIYGDYDITFHKVNGKDVPDTIFPKIPDFKYLNQDSTWIEKSDFHDKLLIVDFMFTHCPDICPTMTNNMKKLNLATNDLKDHLQFLSFSIDPKRDTPSRFKEYIKEHGIKATNWQFLTGDEAATFDLAMDFFKVGVEKSDDPSEGLLHSDHLVLVDTKGYVRGLYSGTQMSYIHQMEKDIRKLLKVEYHIDSDKK